MANGYRLTDVNAVGFFSKSGNDSNNGTTPDTPKKTITGSQLNSLSDYYVIGAGVYNSINVTGGNFSIFKGDGKAILKNLSVWGGAYGFDDVTIKDVTSISNIIFRTAVTSNRVRIINVSKVTTSGVSPEHNFNNCLIKDVPDFCVTSGLSCLIRKSIIINSTVKSNLFENTYIGPNSQIQIELQSHINRINCQGVILILGTRFTDGNPRKYAIQDQLTGTPQDNGYEAGVEWLTEAQLTADGYNTTISGWNTKVANCFNRNPDFNNLALDDYSLQSNSIHIGNASDGSNIGGTQVQTSILVTDNGVGDIEIVASPEIDTSLINSYRLDTGQTQGYTDFIFKQANVSVLVGEIDILADLNFDSDFSGGTIENNNVPDSEPLTSEYPDKLTTTSAAANTTTLEVTAHGRSVGEFVRVLGEDREITSVTTNQITVGTAFRAIIGSGVTFQVGTENQLKALRPNRLTFQIRTSNQSSKPTLDSQWDNDIDPIYGMAGQFLTIENNTQPKYYIDVDDNVYGGGDSELPTGLTANEISAIWVQVRVYLRNNYES